MVEEREEERVVLELAERALEQVTHLRRAVPSPDDRVPVQ